MAGRLQNFQADAPRHRAFTLVELLVVVAIIGILVSFTLSQLSSMKRQGQQIRCASNLQQIAAAMHLWLKGAGFAVPQDVALVMLDLDDSTAGWSGIDQNNVLVGAAAAELLVQLLQRNELSAPQNPIGLTIEGSWVDGVTAPEKSLR